MQWFANIFVFLTFFLVPFLGGNHLPLFYITVDRFWFNTFFLVCTILAILFLYLSGKKPEKGYRRFLLFFLPLLGVMTLSYAYSWNKLGALVGIFPLVASLALAYVNLNTDNRDIILKSIIAGTFVLALCAIFQHKFLFLKLLALSGQGQNLQILSEQSGIAFGSYLHHNMLGGYLAFIFPLSLYFAVRHRNQKQMQSKGFIYIAGSAVLLATVVLTSSRIALGISILSLIAVTILSVQGHDKKSLFRIGGIVVLAVVLSFIFLHDWTGGNKESTIGVSRILAEKTKTIGTQLSTLNTRTTIWRNASQAIKERPLLGFGAGSFEYAYRKYFDGSTYTSVAHSTIVKLLVETGFVGLFSFLLYLAGVVVSTVRFSERKLNFFLSLSCLSGLVFSLVDFSFDIPSHVMTFFFLTSTYFVGTKGKIADGSKNIVTDKSRKMWGALALLPILLVTFLFFSRKDLYQISLEQGISAEELGLVKEALQDYRDAQRYMPLSEEGVLREAELLGRIMSQTNILVDKDKVKKDLANSLEEMKRFQGKNAELYLSLAKGYRTLGDGSVAELYYSLALEYYPSSAYYLVEKANFLTDQGKLLEAAGLIKSFASYAEKYRSRHDPRGIIIYKMRDLEAHIAYRQGDYRKALQIARTNLGDAEKGDFVTGSVRAREYVPREQLLAHLSGRVRFYESECAGIKK